ncbi:MAG: DUF2520 domain-containing protein [Bacteroidota bacterium]|jgi:predicted short-subunit dehydrogenase-like oxidoreductase (DUF2520 family)|nr:DUF2520 domain-containing protein [Bacteroidota bacterium]|tara:strand:+ start:4130 stop:4888 length:759 start_codon:yes stop_codon:yes gene_type:complete
MIKIILLGAGNVGHHLSKAFNKSTEIDLVQWYSRDNSKVSYNDIDTEIINDLSKIKSADIYIISISDSYVGEISKKLNVSEKLVVHTSGSLDLSIIDSKNRRGVFYPLQTLSKNKEIELAKVPICIESENNKDLVLLETISKYIGCKTYKIDYNQRKILHLAAIFSNNFVNHMFTIAKEILDDKNLDFNILKPLINETVDKIHKLDPENAQTGPAIRNNNEIILNHIKTLKKDDHKKLYELMTKLIKDKYGE